MLDIKTIFPAELESMLYKLAHECTSVDYEFIEFQEAFDILDDNKKSLFAEITDKQEGKSLAEKERKALLDPDWAEFLNRLKDARHAMRLARVKRDDVVRRYDTCRSILSSKNTERRTNT